MLKTKDETVRFSPNINPMATKKPDKHPAKHARHRAPVMPVAPVA
jgi:hypothetical protein